MSIKRLIKLNININTLSNMIHDICQEIFLMFDEIAYDVGQGREKLLSDNLPMFLLRDYDLNGTHLLEIVILKQK